MIIINKRMPLLLPARRNHTSIKPHIYNFAIIESGLAGHVTAGKGMGEGQATKGEEGVTEECVKWGRRRAGVSCVKEEVVEEMGKESAVWMRCLTGNGKWRMEYGKKVDYRKMWIRRVEEES